MYSAIWSEAAASHVREIVEYMRTENPLIARKLAHAFALFTDLVEHMPEIAPVWKENSRYRIWSGYIRTKFSMSLMSRKNKYSYRPFDTESGKIRICLENAV